ncbi:MAG: recombinase family protein, partial [Elusimicrobia bacterium]|nr:recombinase family protein [Elusimicrobiota bacterium]
SRNTRDFLHILDIFDKHGIAYVSVTQPIDTGSSVGRLMRSILMDFAQFERELISERTRDKRAAMAKKGKWPGGHPVLGYNVDKETKKLFINPLEAKQVRVLFETYLRIKSLSQTARELNKQGLRMKQWDTRVGNRRGGRRFNKANLDYVLRNPVYLGKIRHKGEVNEGEHKPILDSDIFSRVQKQLSSNGEKNKSPNQNKHNFLLRGLVRCSACGYQMIPNFAHSKGHKYFYYKCLSVNKMDKTACPTKSVPARELEKIVLDRLAFLGRSRELVDRIVARAKEKSNSELPSKRQEKVQVIAQIGKIEADLRNVVDTIADRGKENPAYRALLDKVAELQGRKDALEVKTTELEHQIQDLENREIDAEVIRRNLENFSKVFGRLTPQHQRELLALLIQEVGYAQDQSKIKLTLRPLPDLGWRIDGEKISFDERQIWLRD